MNLALGIDLGGTNIKAALVETASAKVRRHLSRPTRDGEWVDGVPRYAVSVREIVEEMEAEVGERLRVGLCAPGLANPDGSCIEWMPGRMHGLEGLRWASFLQRECEVLNDAQAALLGERWAGAARGCDEVFMLTLGTGVGGAIVSGGRLLRGRIGRAGHLGHVSMDTDGVKDAFLTPASLEQMIGNQSIRERGEGRYATTLDLIAAYAADDAHAAEVWLRSVKHLAVALASLINVLDPERIVIGGGIAVGAGEHLFTPLNKALHGYEWRPQGSAVRIVPAELGDAAGCLGAVSHWRAQVEECLT
jgi:glucokinase